MDRVILVVFKQLVEGDLRKFKAESNDADTGGGARDLRFRPYDRFDGAFERLFPVEELVPRRRNNKSTMVKVRKGRFVFTLVSVADEWRFLKANTVSVMVDEKTVFSGKPKRTTAKEDGKAVEKLSYDISKAAIERIVYGGEVTLKIGDYAIFPGQAVQLLLYNMLQVAE